MEREYRPVAGIEQCNDTSVQLFVCPMPKWCTYGYGCYKTPVGCRILIVEPTGQRGRNGTGRNGREDIVSLLSGRYLVIVMPNSHHPPDTTRRSCRCRVWCADGNWTIALNVFRRHILSATVLSCRESNSHRRSGRDTDKTVCRVN